jgi:hypothetical protein
MVINNNNKNNNHNNHRHEINLQHKTAIFDTPHILRKAMV